MTERIPPEPAAKRPIDHAVTYGLIAILLLLVYRVFSPLFPALLWGFLLAVVSENAYERLAGWLRGRRMLTDALFGLLLLLVLLLPAIFFAWELTVLFPAIHDQIAQLSSAVPPTFPQWLGSTGLGAYLKGLWQTAATELNSDLPHLLSNMRGTAIWAIEEIGSSGAFLLQFVLGAVISLFLLHNRFRVKVAVDNLLMRSGGPNAMRIAERAFSVTRGTFAGVILAAMAQTMLGGVAILAAGLPVVIFAGFIFLLALMQVGPILVIIVADIILIVEGSYMTAALLTLWFVVVVMSVDNFIRPYFASRGSDMPSILTFLGAIGGLIAWGLIGVFVGPVLVSILYEMFVTWNAPLGPSQGEAAARATPTPQPPGRSGIS